MLVELHTQFLSLISFVHASQKSFVDFFLTVLRNHELPLLCQDTFVERVVVLCKYVEADGETVFRFDLTREFSKVKSTNVVLEGYRRSELYKVGYSHVKWKMLSTYLVVDGVPLVLVLPFCLDIPVLHDKLKARLEEGLGEGMVFQHFFLSLETKVNYVWQLLSFLTLEGEAEKNFTNLDVL
jgi:hypothetical protein